MVNRRVCVKCKFFIWEYWFNVVRFFDFLRERVNLDFCVKNLIIKYGN